MSALPLSSGRATQSNATGADGDANTTPSPAMETTKGPLSSVPSASLSAMQSTRETSSVASGAAAFIPAEAHLNIDVTLADMLGDDELLPGLSFPTAGDRGRVGSPTIVGGIRGLRALRQSGSRMQDCETDSDEENGSKDTACKPGDVPS